MSESANIPVVELAADIVDVTIQSARTNIAGGVVQDVGASIDKVIDDEHDYSVVAEKLKGTGTSYQSESSSDESTSPCMCVF